LRKSPSGSPSMRHEFHDNGHADCIASFASASTAVTSMHFEWCATLEKKPVNGLYIMDEDRAWWHFCIDAVLELLDKHRPKMLIGSSMGGYGALLFAQLTGIPAIAFAPQTAISFQEWDERYEPYLKPVRERTKRQDLLDLTVSGDQHVLHYCERNWQDRRHAERLSVRLMPHQCDTHKVAYFLGGAALP
jgi:hypothetical protein